MSVEQFNAITKEKEIAQRGFQDQVDIYNEGIQSIEKREQSVNDKYDKKIKLIDEQAQALDKVLSINEDIAAQQQNQLTLADALTQGDISAAAKAAADYSAQQAEVASRSASEAFNEQRSAMEIAKQKELDDLKTMINGKEYTRKQLAEAITKIQEDSIAPLEKDIEKRNRLVQAYEDANTKALANVEINKMTATEWDAIKGAVTTLNEAYDAQVIDINAIATSVGGVEGAWTAVSTAIKNAALEVGKYPVFTDKAAADKAIADKAAADKAAADKIAADKAAADALANAGKGTVVVPAAGTETVDPNSARGRLNAYLKAKEDRLAAAEEKRKLEEDTKARAAMLARLRSLGIGLSNGGVVPKYMAKGGVATKYMPMGGLVPYMNNGGMFEPKGTDTVPAMLTPGEFVVRRSVADQYGALLQSLNNGTYKTFEAPTFSSMANDSIKVGSGSASSSADNSSKVYNYNVGISVSNTNASPDDIAKVVMAEIKYIDSQRLRGQR
jgi:hypothetical protein